MRAARGNVDIIFTVDADGGGVAVRVAGWQLAPVERAAGFAHDALPKTKLDKLDALLAQSFTLPQGAALFAEMLTHRGLRDAHFADQTSRKYAMTMAGGAVSCVRTTTKLGITCSR